jgi:predicted RNA-binding Zn ribbon-like protein
MSVRSSQGAATEAGSSPAAAARPRFTRGDAALLAGGVALTALLAAAAARRPTAAIALLVVVALAALVLLNRDRIARVCVGTVGRPGIGWFA